MSTGAFCSLCCAVLLPVALAAQDRDADSLLHGALDLARRNQLEEAERTLSDGRKRFPTDKRFPTELAGIEFKRGHRNRAVAYLHDALRLDPADRYANEFLGTVYLLDGNLEAALTYWNRIGKPLLASVRIVPEPKLDPVLRARTFEVSAGQVLTLERLRRTQANLALLNLLPGCRFELAQAADDRFDLTVRPTSRASALRGWPGRLLPFARGLPYQQLNIDFDNIRQRAINVTSLLRWDSNKRRAALDLSAPLGAWRYDVIFDARDENWDLRPSYRGTNGAIDGLLLRKAEGGVDFARVLSERVRWTSGFRVATRDFRHGDGSPFFSNGWSFDVRNRVDARLWSWPEQRVRMDGWGLLGTGQILGGEHSRLISAEGGASTAWTPGHGSYTVRNELRSGATAGNAPLDELFLLGMERDTDLWLRGHVGTRDGRKGNAPMGRDYSLIRTGVDRELFAIPMVHLTAGPFFDTGRVGDPSGNFGSHGWLYDTGVQANLRTIGGIRFVAVYGRNLRDGGGVFYTAITR